MYMIIFFGFFLIGSLIRPSCAQESLKDLTTCQQMAAEIRKMKDSLSGDQIRSASQEQIKEYLWKMSSTDQQARAILEKYTAHHQIVSAITSIDQSNTQILKRIIKYHGWPTISNFGKEADTQAWLIAQHSDHDVPFQEEVLSLMQDLYPLQETSADHYAYLHDRINVNKRQPQRYGTQGQLTQTGWEPFPLEDAAQIEHWRKQVGLGSFKEYQKTMSALYKPMSQ